MTLATIPRRWKIRTAHLSIDLTPSPIERLCKHGVWVRREGRLVCRNCGKAS